MNKDSMSSFSVKFGGPRLLSQPERGLFGQPPKVRIVSIPYKQRTNPFLDVTRYMPLFSKTGTLILQLDNVVTPSLNGQFASTSTLVSNPIFLFTVGILIAQLHATFYASSSKYPPAKKADLIIPISTLRDDTGAQASVPPALTVSPLKNIL